ncbi:MAG: hypothetical protein KAR13_02155, partial [Desulfobulbaceae bacterium]|nr:hypothetical protein [Desulfobulbaceae bacterium]
YQYANSNPLLFIDPSGLQNELANMQTKTSNVAASGPEQPEPTVSPEPETRITPPSPTIGPPPRYPVRIPRTSIDLYEKARASIDPVEVGVITAAQDLSRIDQTWLDYRADLAAAQQHRELVFSVSEQPSMPVIETRTSGVSFNRAQALHSLNRPMAIKKGTTAVAYAANGGPAAVAREANQYLHRNARNALGPNEIAAPGRQYRISGRLYLFHAEKNAAAELLGMGIPIRGIIIHASRDVCSACSLWGRYAGVEFVAPRVEPPLMQVDVGRPGLTTTWRVPPPPRLRPRAPRFNLLPRSLRRLPARRK